MDSALIPVYDAKDVVRIFGKSQAWLTTQVYRGHIVPSEMAIGSGQRHKFSFADLVKTRIFLWLSERGGLGNAYAAIISQHDALSSIIAEQVDAPPGNCSYIKAQVEKSPLQSKIQVTVQYIDDPQDLEKNLRQDDYAFIVNIGRAVSWVKRNQKV